MGSRVRVLYDFEAQSGSGELTIRTDEILSVTREGIEGGWLEGVNARGIHGLFPQSYVEFLPPSGPPPPLRVASHPPDGSTSLDDFDDDWTEEEEGDESAAIEGGGGASRSRHSVICDAHGARAPRSQSRGTSGSCTDFETDEETVSAPTAIASQGKDSVHSAPSVSRRREAGGEGASGSTKGTIRMKNINWFSNFVKSGMEAYILTGPKMTTQPLERHEVVLRNGRAQWTPITQHYTCVVDKPKKESKLKGLKSFIAYSVTSSLSGIQVSKRYKHFDWLHEQLSAKYITIPIPPLPEKQVSGRYEEDLIEHRKAILQLWVNKICRHPVLSKSDVWVHFITCTDEKQWKNGKRRAEKDEYVGGNFFNCVAVPQQPVDHNLMERQLDGCVRMTRSLDDSMRSMFDRLNDTHKRMTGPYKSNWQKMGLAFHDLHQSFELDPASDGAAISIALKRAANVYHGIGELHDEQAKRDTEPLMDALYAHRGLIQAVPNIVNIYKSAVGKLRERERADGGDVEGVRSRVDTVSYTVQAEMTHMSQERINDFKTIMSAFIGEQAQFYAKISQQLMVLKSAFDDAA